MLAEAAELEGVDEVFPISARTRRGAGRRWSSGSASWSPRAPTCTRRRTSSDQSSELLLAELIREQVLNRTRAGDPALGRGLGQGGRRRARTAWSPSRAEIWAETESQKGILIGKGGAKIGEIGTAARRSLEARAGAKVHLDLQVRVRRRWRRDEDLLDRLGIE